MKGEPTPYEKMGYSRPIDPPSQTLDVSTWRSGSYVYPDRNASRNNFTVKLMEFVDGQWHIVCVDGLEHWFNADQLHKVEPTEWWRNKSTLRTSSGQTYGDMIMAGLDHNTRMWLHDHSSPAHRTTSPNFYKLQRLLHIMWYLEWHCCGP